VTNEMGIVFFKNDKKNKQVAEVTVTVISDPHP
jgi:hypothetical protein